MRWACQRTVEGSTMAIATTARRFAQASLGAVATAGLLFGAVVPAGAATPDQSTTATAGPSVRDASDSTAFLGLINKARQHPELYPPHGNTAGAKMTGCSNSLNWSSRLGSTSLNHSKYLAGKPLGWVSTYPNMHRGPDGRLVWESGEPMDRAGYHSYRAEIVAWGFPTKEAALRFWMQDDAASNWGHRNLILNCAIQDAGPGSVHHGPGGHYYTVDMGTR